MPKRIRGGNDTDVLDGSSQKELIGGRGNDHYIVYDPETIIVERKNGGTDTVEAHVDDYALPEWVEHLELHGPTARTGTGNALDNTISGNELDNNLFGLGGDDELFGAGGSDYLDGGDGFDTAVFEGKSTDYVIEVQDENVYVSYAPYGEVLSKDTVRSIERLSFDDTTIIVAELQPVSEQRADPIQLSTTPDYVEIQEDTSVIINAAGNDQGTGLAIVAVGSAALGDVSIEPDGQLKYTPFPDSYGTDTFEYTVEDEFGIIATNTVTVEILGVNDAPEAAGEIIEVEGFGPYSSTQSLLDNDYDADGDSLSIVSFDSITANGGTVSVANNGLFTYEPISAYDANGEVATGDSFAYQISDGHGGTSTATVELKFLSQSTEPASTTQTSEETVTVPDYVFEALLHNGLGDTTLRWNADDPLKTPITITYSFLEAVPDYYGSTAPEQNNFQPFSEEQRASVVEALENIESFTGITFVEHQGDVGDITFGTADYAGTGWAYAPTGSNQAGDVWLNNSALSNEDLSPGGDGYMTLIHEIGHALGLEHPHEGNMLPEDELSRQYTVMSYAEHTLSAGVEPSSFMLYDIAALQHLYGTNATASAGDDIYDISNLNDTVMTIWDSAGWDVLDASSESSDVLLNLNQGEFSTSGTANGWYPISENIGIAYGTLIEEAIGGNGNDILIGNASNNQLTGGMGSDIFVVGSNWGEDRITDFEDGTDKLDMSSLGIGIDDLLISNDEGSTIISYGDSNITLIATDAGQIDETDFLWGFV